MRRSPTSVESRVEILSPEGDTPGIGLCFGDGISPSVRARVAYALRVFAAIHGYKFLEGSQEGAAIRLNYGESSVGANPGARALNIPARYRVRMRGEPVPRITKRDFAGEKVPLFHGLDERSGRTDWLGEIFEWLSGSHELETAERDFIGRVPYSASIFAREMISPRTPYVSVLMAWLQSAIEEAAGGSIRRAPSPSPDADHFVVSSHDVDFHWVRPASALWRLTKNLGIAVNLYRSRSHFHDTTAMIRGVLAGRRAGDYIPALLHAGEKFNFQSTLFVVARHGHRRDPDYCLNDIRRRLVEAHDAGFEVELHGSYLSVMDSDSLADEALELAKSVGKPTIGGRQHWLRFDSQQKLFGSVAGARLVFDSSLGFAETVGFRNGASFAFPPYNFAEEKPFDFLEIPLGLMDGSLEAAARTNGEDAAAIANEVLSESRRWGWGGIATLWHNPIEPLSVPTAINDVFWRCVAQQDQHREKWISASDFVRRSLSRYQNAGLLKGVQLDA